MKNIRIFKLMTGEMLITETTDYREKDDGYLISYPLVIVPIPPEQVGGEPNRIGFAKFMPFSNYQKDIVLYNKSIAVDSEADDRLSKAYEQQVQQLRSQESGIVLSQSIPKDVLKDATAKDFSDLNM